MTAYPKSLRLLTTAFSLASLLWIGLIGLPPAFADGKDEQARGAEAETSADQALLAKIAVKDKSPEVRKAAIQRLNDQSLLAKIAIGPERLSVRLAAVKTLTDRSLLARIADRQNGMVCRNSGEGTFFYDSTICVAALKAIVTLSDAKKKNAEMEGALADYSAALALKPLMAPPGKFPRIISDQYADAASLQWNMNYLEFFDLSYFFAEVHNDLGDTYVALGEDYKAIAEYDAAIKTVDHTPSPGHQYSIIFHSYMGGSEARKLAGDLPGSVAYSDKATEWDEKHSTQQLLANIKAQAERAEEDIQSEKRWAEQHSCDKGLGCAYLGQV